MSRMRSVWEKTSNARSIHAPFFGSVTGMDMTTLDPFPIARAQNRVVFWRRCVRQEDCAICLSQMSGKSASVYPCGHYVHNRCHRRLRRSSCASRHHCPICRRGLPQDTVADDDVFADILLELNHLHILWQEETLDR